MTTGGWTKDEGFPTNNFRWNQNRKENIGFKRWCNGQFTTVDHRLEQLWEKRPAGEVAPFLKEWRRITVSIDGFKNMFKPVPYKEGEP